MTSYFQIGDFIFFPQKNEIHRAEKIIKVRPKTADLLRVLVDANGDIVSKSELLERVWSDVVAEEYVVFQSIAELRKIFDDAKVIKTHPRKGYSVAVVINKYQEQSEPEVTLEPSAKAIASPTLPQSRSSETVPKPRKYSKRAGIYAVLVLAMFVMAVFAMKIGWDKPEASANSGSIVILPVNNRTIGTEHMWLRYGGMDQLVESLQPQVDALVVPTEMVLDTIMRSGIEHENIAESDMARLFEVSGAQWIVAQSISGASGEFELVYSLYERDNVTRGVLFADDIDTLSSQLKSVLLQSMGVTEKATTHSYQHNFSNAMMASAMDATQLGDYHQAATMFKAVLVAEPENVLAIKMLVKALVHVGRYAEAETIAADAVKYVMQSGDNRNLGRLFFWQAVSIVQQRRYDDALSILHYAKAKSEHTNDVLYLANVSRIAGKLYLQKKQFVMALGEIDKAMSLYKRINEPYGQASMYIDLGELELAQDNTQSAKKAFEQALDLATQSRLTQLIDMANEWLRKI